MSSTGLETPFELLGTLSPGPIYIGALRVFLIHGTHVRKHQDLSQKSWSLPGPNPQTRYTASAQLPKRVFHEGKYKTPILLSLSHHIESLFGCWKEREQHNRILGVPQGPKLFVRHDKGSSGTLIIRGSPGIVTCNHLIKSAFLGCRQRYQNL